MAELQYIIIFGDCRLAFDADSNQAAIDYAIHAAELLQQRHWTLATMTLRDQPLDSQIITTSDLC